MTFTVVVLAISDHCSRDEQEDRSGPFIAEWEREAVYEAAINLAAARLKKAQSLK